MASILVIEDEADIREYIGHVLELEGHEVKEACHGLEGIRHFRTFQVDLVITDILMPVKEGLETIRDLQHEFPMTKIIAMSEAPSKTHPNLLQIAKSLGAISVLQKPFSINELLEAVKEAKIISQHALRPDTLRDERPDKG